MANINVLRFLEIKSLYDRIGFVSAEVAEMILEDRLNDRLYIEKLEKQLLHSLKTGGEYIEMQDQLH